MGYANDSSSDLSIVSNAKIKSVANADLTYRKISRRLLPFLMFAYVLCYIDRSNISFAYLRFKADVGLSDAAYGFGAGIFYLGSVVSGLFDAEGRQRQY